MRHVVHLSIWGECVAECIRHDVDVLAFFDQKLDDALARITIDDDAGLLGQLVHDFRNDGVDEEDDDERNEDKPVKGLLGAEVLVHEQEREARQEGLDEILDAELHCFRGADDFQNFKN